MKFWIASSLRSSQWRAPKNESDRTFVRPLWRSTTRALREKFQAYDLDFFLAFFFFAMIAVPWCVMNLRKGWFSRRRSRSQISVPGSSPPYRRQRCH